MIKSLSFKIASVHLLLCLFLSPLRCLAQSTSSATTNTVTTMMITASTEMTTLQLTTIATTKAPPEDVKSVTVSGQNKTSITLTWEKVDNIQTYRLEYKEKGEFIVNNINESTEAPSVEYVVSPLTAGTEYTFTLFTVLDGVNSTGHLVTAYTTPEDVKSVNVSGQNKTSITLTWEKVNNIQTYRLEYNEKGEFTVKNINESTEAPSVEYVVSPLTAGTEYNFTLFTVLDGVNSTGLLFTAVTAPEDVKSVTVSGQNKTSITLTWEKVNNIQTYRLEYNEKDEFTVKNISESNEATSVEYVVSPLTAGTEYTFTLFTVFDNVRSSGLNKTAVTAPEDVKSVNVSGQNKTSITLTWEKVNNIQTYRLEYNEKGEFTVNNINESIEAPSVEYVVSPLTAGTEYNFTLFTVLDGVNSTGLLFTAVTAPEDVKSVNVSGQNETSITLTWEKVYDIQTYRLEYPDNGNITVKNISESNETSVEYVVSPLTAGTIYNFTLFTVFDNVRSSGLDKTAVTAPENVKSVNVSGQNEASITLKWEKVYNIETYRLEYPDNGNITVRNISESNETSVEYVVSPLTAGTKYTFTLFTMFEKITSSGLAITAVTAPLKVDGVNMIERSVTSVTLQWEKVHDVYNYSLHINGIKPIPISPNSSSDVVTHLVSSLNAGTEYSFILFAEVYGIKSTGFTGFILTAINCTTYPWHVTNSSIQGNIEGLFSKATASNAFGNHSSPEGPAVVFKGLYPGSTYEVVLLYEKDSQTFIQCEHKLTIIPPDLIAHCDDWAAAYSISIHWAEPAGVWTYVEVNVTGNTHKVPSNEGLETQISGFQPAKMYTVSVASLSGPWRSEPYIFNCSTDPRGVIAGAVLAVLLFALLVSLAVFILCRRPDIFSRKKSFISGSKLSTPKYKAIPVGMFPDHFNRMNVDDNRGFSEEYESFIPVGTEQTHKAAIIQDNKAKNRFTNVLPYDWSRVKLTTLSDSEHSDYINASYMPGYNSNRQYIAAQGPLPSTVNDFWRLIWEQSVKGVVMVTNCTEGGRVKCEQYWPLDYTPCCYGDLLVTVTSEQRESNWTLREFGVKNKQTKEERTVKHFHFTAWPDHGVPEGTEALIQFRGLVRQHIENEAGRTPTVVHCSAGVGRTGTIIALDVLLQQLEGEKAVGIAALVHKMRLSRPLMVQTECQYVFLHQCIMNSLQKNLDNEENIYENSDMIYANATALREFHSQANANV